MSFGQSKKPCNNCDDKKEEPKEEKVELTPEQEADAQLMQEFLDEDIEAEEISFGL